MSTAPQYQRPAPPKLNEMCICGRTRHTPMAACPDPQPAGRQRPATPDQVETAVQAARRVLLEAKARAKAAEAQALLDAKPYGPDYP